MTNELKYDPELPFAFVGSNGKTYARFAQRELATRYAREVQVGEVIDTTPKPKIPEDAEFIIWDLEGVISMAYREGTEWYGSGEWWPQEELANALKDAEVTVLVRKEDS